MIAISRLRLQATEALRQQLAQGPVIVQRKGKAVAVLLDPVQWQKLVRQLELEASFPTNRQKRG